MTEVQTPDQGADGRKTRTAKRDVVLMLIGAVLALVLGPAVAWILHFLNLVPWSTSGTTLIALGGIMAVVGGGYAIGGGRYIGLGLVLLGFALVIAGLVCLVVGDATAAVTGFFHAPAF